MANLLLVTSNGTGMGHLTRQAAVALSLSDTHTATLFSLSPGLPLATGLGIPGEYCPSYDRPWIATRNWNSYLRDRLVAIAEETRADAVLFDGVAPYPGIAHAAAALRHVAFIWLRRGMWKNTNDRALGKGAFFDLVIEPGDLASAHDIGPTAALESQRIRPISILEPLGLLPRDEARRRLGLPLDRPVALVTLGSGRLGDVVGPGRVAVETLLAETPDWQVAVTRSPVALNEIPVEQAERITTLSGIYPLATFFSAFDMAVSSAGYNAVHELVPSGVPSLMVANTSTRTDDQVARALGLERQNLALATTDVDLEAVAEKLASLISDQTRNALSESAGATLEAMTGATEAGVTATAFAATFDHRRMTLAQSARRGVERVKEGVRNVLGDERTETLKKALGRQPSPVHQRATVRVVDAMGGAGGDPTELAFVPAVTSADLRQDQPVEHLLDGSSTGYEDRRREIIERYYDVVR